MNATDEERAKLDFGNVDERAVPEKPVVNPETIREISAQAGFRKTAGHTTRKASGRGTTTPRASANLPKRTRRKTGRVHQFSTRIDRATYEAIYEYADHEQITLGETIERAIVSLNNDLLKKPDNISTTEKPLSKVEVSQQGG